MRVERLLWRLGPDADRRQGRIDPDEKIPPRDPLRLLARDVRIELHGLPTRDEPLPDEVDIDRHPDTEELAGLPVRLRRWLLAESARIGERDDESPVIVVVVAEPCPAISGDHLEDVG